MIWFVDSEWSYSQGRFNSNKIWCPRLSTWTPVVFCLVGYQSGDRYYFWGRDPSWRVLLTIIGKAATGDVAHLQIKDICGVTGLCERTVKSAVGELRTAGIIVRVGRVGAFSVPILSSSPKATGLMEVGEPATITCFTAKQVFAVRRALREAGALLGVDPASITMPVSYCEQLGLDPGITFHVAFLSIKNGTDRALARRFVGLVLEFRHSEAVGGTPALVHDL